MEKEISKLQHLIRASRANVFVVTSMLFCGVQTGVAADRNTQLNLRTAYLAALEYDAKIAAAKSALESDQEQVGYARSFLLPNISAAASGAYNKSSVDYTNDSSTGPQDATTPYFEKYSYSLRLTQPVYRKNYIDGLRQAHYLGAQGELRYQMALQDFTLRVAQTYFDLLLAQNNVELSNVELQANAKHLETANKAHLVGATTVTEVYDAQARYDLTQARAIAAKSQLEIAQQSLTRLIGYTPQSQAQLKDSFPLITPEPSDVNVWKSSAAKENFQVRSAQADVDVARLEIERQRGMAYPALDFVAAYGNNTAGDSTFGGGNNSVNTSVALELSVPLFAGGAVSIKTRQLVAARQRSVHLFEDALREADMQTQQTFSAVVNGVEQIKALQQVEKSSQSSLDVTQKGYQYGLRTLIDVLNAQQQLFSAKRDLVSAKYQYLINRLKLKAVVGQLAISDIEGIDTVLEFKQ